MGNMGRGNMGFTEGSQRVHRGFTEGSQRVHRGFTEESQWDGGRVHEPLFIAVRGPLTVAASLVAEHRLQTRRLSNCGSRA